MLRARALVVVLVAMAAPAGADEGGWVVALQPGVALQKVGDRGAWGGGGGADASLFVTEALALRLTGGASVEVVPEKVDATSKKVTAPGGMALTWFAGAGITWSIDRLRLVPYVDLAVGVIGTDLPDDKVAGKRAGAVEPGVQVGLGVDYRVNRHLSLGFVVRYHAGLTTLAQLPVYLYAGPRLALHFGGRT